MKCELKSYAGWAPLPFEVTIPFIIPTSFCFAALELPLINDLSLMPPLFSSLPNSGSASISKNARTALTTSEPNANAMQMSHCCQLSP